MDQVHPNAILTREEVAAWLKVRPRQVERLRIPHMDLGRKTKRYFAKDVLSWHQAKCPVHRTLTSEITIRTNLA